MRRLLVILLLGTGAALLPLQARAQSAASAGPGTHRNLFAELLGKSDEEVTAKLDRAWRHLFYGRDSSERVYYPVGEDMAYIADIGSNDVRSEGMSYGMMIAVQMNKKEEFDRLWRWTKKHMYHAKGPRAGYFAWHCTFEGRQLDEGSASDGEIWFAMTLYLAAGRWGSGDGDLNYLREADALLEVMLHKHDPAGKIMPIFNREHQQVVFVPSGPGSRFTDPSYHVPHFYEWWARWDPEPADRAFWKEAAQVSRAYFKKAAHPQTGLMPEYSNFDGSPRPGDRGDFRFDAWRTLANVALDHAWFAADPWHVEQSNRVLRFLLQHWPRIPNQFALDGRPLSKEPSLGLYAMAATAGLAADPDLAKPFVEYLWNAQPPSGQWRYYNGLLYHLALLQVSGNFRVYEPVREGPAKG